MSIRKRYWELDTQTHKLRSRVWKSRGITTRLKSYQHDQNVTHTSKSTNFQTNPECVESFSYRSLDGPQGNSQRTRPSGTYNSLSSGQSHDVEFEFNEGLKWVIPGALDWAALALPKIKAPISMPEKVTRIGTDSLDIGLLRWAA